VKPPAPDVTRLLESLVDGPVRAQAELDRGWAESITRWRDTVQYFIVHAPPPDRVDIAAVLAPTAPIRQVLHSYEIDCAVRLHVHTQRGGGIRVEPLDLGWEIIRGASRSTASSVHVEVRSVPLPASSPVEARAPAWLSSPLSPPEEGDH
jgi:hypothetical protein